MKLNIKRAIIEGSKDYEEMIIIIRVKTFQLRTMEGVSRWFTMLQYFKQEKCIEVKDDVYLKK